MKTEFQPGRAADDTARVSDLRQLREEIAADVVKQLEQRPAAAAAPATRKPAGKRATR